MAQGHVPGAAASNGNGIALAQEKYNQERDKRLHADGNAQFADLFSQEKFKRFQADLWAEKEGHSSLDLSAPPKEGDHSEILIAGAGYGGLLYAVRLIQEGFRVEDIRMVDSAAGFGGTWCKTSFTGTQNYD